MFSHNHLLTVRLPVSQQHLSIQGPSRHVSRQKRERRSKPALDTRTDSSFLSTSFPALKSNRTCRRSWCWNVPFPLLVSLRSKQGKEARSMTFSHLRFFSPRWLAQQGRHEEAFQSLLRLHGKDANREVVQYEIDEIVTQVSRVDFDVRRAQRLTAFLFPSLRLTD